MSAKNTFALRDFKNGDENIAKGTDLAGLPANQLRDFQIAGLVGAKSADPEPAPGKA